MLYYQCNFQAEDPQRKLKLFVSWSYLQKLSLMLVALCFLLQSLPLYSRLHWLWGSIHCWGLVLVCYWGWVWCWDCLLSLHGCSNLLLLCGCWSLLSSCDLGKDRHRRIAPCHTGAVCFGQSVVGGRFTWRGEKDSLAKVIECTPVHSMTFPPVVEKPCVFGSCRCSTICPLFFLLLQIFGPTNPLWRNRCRWSFHYHLARSWEFWWNNSWKDSPCLSNYKPWKLCTMDRASK